MPNNRQSRREMVESVSYSDTETTYDTVKSEPTTTDGTALAADLLAQCQTLLSELEAFSEFVAEQKLEQDSAAETRRFQASVITELKSLEKLAAADLTAEKTIHTLRSSNLPFYSAIWEAAKASKNLVTFHKRYYWDHTPTRHTKKAACKRCALVDVVTHDGEEWIKVSTITESRLAFEIAKDQWELADSSYSKDEEEDLGMNGIVRSMTRAEEDDHLSRIELVKVADDLQRAAKACRIHYQHPRIRFVLSKIGSRPAQEILPVLDRIRATGAVIDLGPSTSSSGSIAYLRSNVFPQLLTSVHPPLTDTLNIDCTILLALVSDLSYSANHPILDSYNIAITRQIELETKEHLLPTSLWPAMSGKKMVCTQEAARRMKEIVDTIGMEKEKSRTALLLSSLDEKYDEKKGAELRVKFAKYSDYTIPSEWQLPIRIMPAAYSKVDLQAAIEANRLPPVALKVAEQMTDINCSVFMYGWLHGVTTVSSNRTVAKQIESIIVNEGSGAIGPDIWLREPARSLLGKEKERRK